VRLNLTKTRDLFIISLEGKYALEEINAFYYIFCEEILGFSKIDAALNRDFCLSSSHQNILQETIYRLLKFEPIQYIYGVAHFYHLKFKVTSEVLIPRPETEELVDIVIKNTKNQAVKILDIGTGSGCISISLAKNLALAEVSAIDISENALQIAIENALLNNVKVQFIQKDILNTNRLTQKYDIIISNPPYVKEDEKKEMNRNVLEYEPALALFVSNIDPLIFYKKIALLAFNHLNDQGILYLEINQSLGKEMIELVKHIGFKEVNLKKDFLGNDRFILAEK
jgi:release factor glutamine methyltransferase